MANALSPLNYLGGKGHMSRHSVDLFPRHKVYAELFFSCGAVLYRKAPAPVEIANDVDDRVTNFFDVLRTQTPKLKRLLTLTPYSRTEYDRAEEITGDPLEDARRFFIRSRQSFGGNSGDVWARTLSKSKAVDFANVVDQLDRFAKRMRRVQIENRCWRELLSKLDRPGTLLYLDPPYLHDARSDGAGYRHEMTEADHIDLLESVVKLKRAKWVLSGYESPLYRRYLNKSGIDRLKFEHGQRVSRPSAETASKAVRWEMLWMN